MGKTELCEIEYKCSQCESRFLAMDRLREHATNQHELKMYTCDSCGRYRSERRADVDRHRRGCMRRLTRDVTSETIGEWDLSPGGTRRESCNDRHRKQRLTDEGVLSEKRGRERDRSRDKEGKSKKAKNAKDTERDEQGQSRRDNHNEQEEDEATNVTGEAAEDEGAESPPPVQRCSSILGKLLEIGSPFPELKAAEDEAKRDKHVTETRNSYMSSLGKGMTLTVTTKTLMYPDGRVLEITEREITRV